MKKFLSIIKAIGLTAIGTSNIFACGGGKTKTVKQPTTPQQEPTPKKINLENSIRRIHFYNIKFGEEINKNWSKKEILSELENKKEQILNKIKLFNPDIKKITINDFKFNEIEFKKQLDGNYHIWLTIEGIGKTYGKVKIIIIKK